MIPDERSAGVTKGPDAQIPGQSGEACQDIDTVGRLRGVSHAN